MNFPGEALHHERNDDPRRDEHLGSENPRRVPVKPKNDPAHADLPENDLDRETDEVPDRTRRDMH